jgi:putative acetyltransferase
MIIREIQKKDNPEIAHIVQSVLMEMGAPKIGTAYSDPFLFELSEVYRQPKTIYFVLENEGKIVGGAGIGTLDNDDPSICEFQKMYFLPEARSKGFASKMMELSIEKANEFGYKKCYIETMHYMEAAQKLYRKFGFKKIDAPIGNTGHTSCPVWMLLDLNSKSQ